MATCKGFFSHDSLDAITNLWASSIQDGAALVFYGDLGAGKTTMIRSIASNIGITDPISSPTFSIVQQYSNHIPFYHIDCYRIDHEHHIIDIGIDDILQTEKRIVCVEWPDRIPSYIPTDALKISLDYADQDNVRLMTLSSTHSKFDQLIQSTQSILTT